MLGKCFLLVIEHLQEALLLQLALDIGNLSHVSPVLNEDVEASGSISLLCELELLIVLVVGTVGYQHLDYLHEELPEVIDHVMGDLELFL